MVPGQLCAFFVNEANSVPASGHSSCQTIDSAGEGGTMIEELIGSAPGARLSVGLTFFQRPRYTSDAGLPLT